MAERLGQHPSKYAIQGKVEWLGAYATAVEHPAKTAPIVARTKESDMDDMGRKR
jgi:hypothetical protein